MDDVTKALIDEANRVLKHYEARMGFISSRIQTLQSELDSQNEALSTYRHMSEKTKAIIETAKNRHDR